MVMVNDSEKVVSDLKKFLGEEGVSGRRADRLIYGQDSFGFDVEENLLPIAAVRPKSAQEMSEVMKYVNEHKIPVYVHGGGTAFKGSPRPKREGSIIISMERFTKFEMHEEDIYFEVGAGVTQLDLENMLLEKGYMLPMNMGSKFAGTIGGAVAINTIGHMVDYCMGKIIDHVLALEVVLPNGAIINTGTHSIRRPAGIDYTRFFAATEGEFGIITNLRLRLIPDPKKAYIIGFFKELKDIAYAFMKYYEQKNPFPIYGEYLEEEAAKASFRVRGLGKPKGSMALAITIGHTQEDADLQAKEMVRVFKDLGALEARVVTDEKEREDYWLCRDNIMNMLNVEEGKEKLIGTGYAECPVPLHNLPDLIDYYRSGHNHEILYDTKLLLYGHVGTCDLHAMWACPISWTMDRRKQALKEATMLEKDVYLKWGCAAGEVGQTALRIPFLREAYGEDAYNMLVSMKKAVDPNNILNPGNLGEGPGYTT